MKSILVLARPTEGDDFFYTRWEKLGPVYKNYTPYPTDIGVIVTDQYTKITGEHKLLYPNLKYVVSPTTGVTHLALDELDDEDVIVLTLRGETAFLETITSVAEHTLYLLLQLSKVASRPPMKLAGKRALIMGMGRVGKQVRTYFKALGIQTYGFDKHIPIDELRAMITFSDIVTIHMSEESNNYRFFDKELLNRLKKDALFINTSRASLVDNYHLHNLCLRKRIKGAAVDVWDIDRGQLENLIITPHVGGRSLEDRIATDIFMINKLKRLYNNQIHSQRPIHH